MYVNEAIDCLEDSKQDTQKIGTNGGFYLFLITHIKIVPLESLVSKSVKTINQLLSSYTF